MSTAGWLPTSLLNPLLVEVIIGVGEVEIFVGQSNIDFDVLVGVFLDNLRFALLTFRPIEGSNLHG